MIVMEYMERGNLRHVLDTTDASLLPIHRRIQMALDGALGLYCIHHMDRAMLHLDLSSHRFLVNAKWEVKVNASTSKYSAIVFSYCTIAIVKLLWLNGQERWTQALVFLISRALVGVMGL